MNTYPLSEEGISALLEKYYDTPGYADLVAATEQFRNDIIAEAENAYETELTGGMIDDPYYDLAESYEGDFTLDSALSALDAPGWGYTTDAIRIIEDFDSNVKWALEVCEPGFVADPHIRIFEW